MNNKDIEGFLSPFFDTQNPKIKDSKIIEFHLNNSFKYDTQEWNYVYEKIFDELLKTNNDYNRNFREDYISIIKNVLIEYLNQEDVLKYFCLDEEYDKVINLVNRKQFNSNQVKLVINRVSFFLERIEPNYQILSLVLKNDIKCQITHFENNYVIKTMGPLKKLADAVASGVNLNCYLEFNKGYWHHNLSNELINYVKDKHGYDLSNIEYSFKKTTLEKVLSLAVVNKEDFWNFKYSQKTLFTFISLVEKYNDIKHAIKIIDYAFESACKDSKIKMLYDNKLPFYLYDLEDDMINFASTRLNNILKIKNLSQEEKNGLIYPIHKGYEKEINEGKEIFLEFINNQYPNDYNKILEIFNNVETVIQDETKVKNGVANKRCTMHNMLEFELYAYDDIEAKEKYLSISYDGYTKQKNILARFYYRLYIIKKHTKDLYETCIYEYLYTILKMIDYKYHITCSYVTDQSFRDSKYNIVKSILSKYGINISDSYKDLYITALLDRKYATFDEASMFAELEQLGDAIYELAVDNIIFYNPKKYIPLDHIIIEKYVNADAQVKVAKAICLEKAYISKLNDKFNNKYDGYEDVESGLTPTLIGHYLADCLEMIIGAIAKEFDIQKALDFATSVILEANKDLNEPEFYKNLDIVKSYYDPNIDKDYLAKIYPNPFLDDSDYATDYHMISYALIKILKIAIIGNDTREKRKMIANGLNSLLPNYNPDEYYQIVASYLHNGIEKTINDYRSIVESSYSKN